jgi:uncharacterized protein (DUF1800 family)
MPLPSEQIPALALWEPLHRDDWGPAEARHFLERAGFAATGETVEEALDLGPTGAVERWFSETVPFGIPGWIEEKFEKREELREKAKEAESREERRPIYRERNQIGREAMNELAFEWLLRASRPENGFRAKWELFLSDVWVVGQRAVGEPEWMASYWRALAEKSDLPYPRFCKDFSREPAMVRYLDLHRNSKRNPNENFARELLELFALGEGNYTESDIKEAARAFTGRRLWGGEYREVERQFDDGEKTVFGKTGPWDGDDVIDLVFEQPAARTFLPSEAIRFYLTRSPFPPERLRLLGDLWAEEGFRLDALRGRLFASRAFYAPDFRGNRIKSPFEFYLGTLRRFGLDPVPIPLHALRPLRDMGQEVFEPPNVRGWIGGEAWINAGKLAARRRFAADLFSEIDEDRLNADDRQRLERERERGNDRHRLDRNDLLRETGRSPGRILRYIEEEILAAPIEPGVRRQLRDYLGPNPGSARIETALVTLLQSPQYQLS